MFFILSKLFWMIFAPLNFLASCILFALIALFFNKKRLAFWVLALSWSAFAVIGFTQIANVPLAQLEATYSVPNIAKPLDGIIVLGGGIYKGGYNPQSDYHLFSASDRIIKGLALKRRFPNARLIFTGGSGDLLGKHIPEAMSAKALSQDLFNDDSNLELETKSRNTMENAINTAKMIKKSDRKKNWLLVTSAWHMPRAMMAFKTMGFSVTPYPTDFTAGQLTIPYLTPYPLEQFFKLDLYLKEKIGMIAYRYSFSKKEEKKKKR